jgi:nitroreductase
VVTELNSQVTSNNVTDVLLNSYSERAYTTVPVSDEQLDIILKCGIKAPSAVNRQPWKFTVIRDEETMRDAVKDITPGNVLIIISGNEAQPGSGPNMFDCGLATESMFVAAHGLGLGARIYGSPVGNINKRRDAFQLPEGYQAVMVLRIGNVDRSVDATSSASPRKSQGEIVNFKK